MAMESLILLANPGSASRKYALFRNHRVLASLHFENENDHVVCTLETAEAKTKLHPKFEHLSDASQHVMSILQEHKVLDAHETIARVGLRIVAPSSFFLHDHVIDDEIVERLRALQPRAPLHITATLEELESLRPQFAEAKLIGVSDSAFHITKPDYAWNYGLPLHDADRLDIKRFGYHGLSVAAAVHALHTAHKLPAKVVVCHLGSGASITAVHAGKSLDTTMGYSPLEGVIMATRSGSIDPTAVRVLKDELRLNDEGIEAYLNNHSGLQGLGGASDIRELLEREGRGEHHARLALQTYVFSVQKAVGQMVAALGGVDLLAFTGTVGERSAPVRARILERFHYLDFFVDERANEACAAPHNPTRISRLAHSKPIFVIPTDEAAEMVRHVLHFT